MFQVRLNRSDGKALDISIPENDRELKLWQKISIDFTTMEVSKMLKEKEGNIRGGRAEYAMIIARGLSEALEIDLNILLDSEGLSLLEMTDDEFIAHLESTITNKSINFKSLEKSLLETWGLLCYSRGTEEVKFDSHSITYKGVEYQLPKTTYNHSQDTHTTVSPTFQQAYNILMIQNRYNSRMKEIAADSQRAIGFLTTKLISEVAILLEPEIPMDQHAFDTWLDEKIRH